MLKLKAILSNVCPWKPFLQCSNTILLYWMSLWEYENICGNRRVSLFRFTRLLEPLASCIFDVSSISHLPSRSLKLREQKLYSKKYFSPGWNDDSRSRPRYLCRIPCRAKWACWVVYYPPCVASRSTGWHHRRYTRIRGTKIETNRANSPDSDRNLFDASKWPWHSREAR